MPRRPGVLINASREESLAREPLLAFSFYLAGRVGVLDDTSAEIVRLLDRGFDGDRGFVRGEEVGRASTLMWFWTLGAYEVVRTMCQAATCFSKRAHDELVGLKRQLAVVRMPSAKMEKVRSNTPVTSNRSPDGWDMQRQDLIIGDPDTRPDVYARDLLAAFDRVVWSITSADVLAPHSAG